MKKQLITILILTLVGICTQCATAQIDSSIYIKLQQKLLDIKKLNDKRGEIMLDVFRYEKLLKKHEITEREFNDLINDELDLIDMIDNKYELKMRNNSPIFLSDKWTY